MIRFWCPVCSSELFFDDARCANCGSDLVFSRADLGYAVALERHRCANHGTIGCAWSASGPGELCSACALTRTRPPADNQAATQHWALAERAKRHAVVELDRLGLVLRPRRTADEEGLAIDMHWSDDGSVTIGHAGGVITLDTAEADDVRRTELAEHLDERYRTMLGHLRHELGRYWWPALTGTSRELDRFRATFGDERTDYEASVDRHYEHGPPDGWEQEHVSAYATMHPWEDWAETFAHYLHLRDTLDTAASFGLAVTNPTLRGAPTIHSTAAADDRDVDVDQLLHQWGALTVAVNALNRSMDLPDLYPFVLTDAVRHKLGLVHDLVALGSAD